MEYGLDPESVTRIITSPPSTPYITKVIKTQPSKNEKKNNINSNLNDKFSHKTTCEKCCTSKCQNKYGNENCYTNFSDWADFNLRCNNHLREDICCISVICFPITLTIKTVFCLPCTCYNFGRNKCNNTNNLNYLC